MHTIEPHIDDFLKNHANDFSFRKNQKESIIEIVKAFLDNKEKPFILESPVGSGKSIIALVVSYVLNRMGYSGYILASDTTLHEQYENDIANFKLGFGCVKGIDNYICSENNEKHSLGECHIRNIPAEQIKTLGCYKTCSYYCARDYAKCAKTSVLTYSYWLIQRNYVARNPFAEAFAIRDFLICDESHKISDIIQNHFSPQINTTTFPQLEKLRAFVADKNFGGLKVDPKHVEATLNKLQSEEDILKLQSLLNEFELQLSIYKEKSEDITDFIKRKYAFKSVPADWRRGMYICDYVKDMHCKFQDYNEIIKNTGVESLIKNPSEGNIVFNCLDESYLLKTTFHEQAGFKFLMSATIGDPDIYSSSMKLNESVFKRIGSTFDFSKSPIFIFTGKRMNYEDREQNMSWMVNKIRYILNLHHEESGIIHTGSYSFTQELMSGLSTEEKKRILHYTNTAEKKSALFDFLNTKGKVLIGPSLTEGINLVDDKSRFQIFMKVPFPSLSDRFIAAKLKKDQTWYNQKTIIAILQGVGRSIRNEKDFAKTYILDGSFAYLYGKNQNSFTDDFKNRIVWVQHDTKNWEKLKPLNFNI
jgi:Rad3-related DNA helicase